MYEEKAIIYIRKSTDREDKQQISLKAQLDYCEALAVKKNLEIFIIEESHSAKTENKRPGFKQLLTLCKKGKYDYVIAYDPTRISRNTIDSAYFTELINKQHIKGFYSADTGQFFDGENIFSALMLGISFLMSKADNQMRASNTKKKMKVYFEQGRVMGYVPFGYKNKQFFDEEGFLRKDVIVEEEKAKIIKQAFRMRYEGYSLREIKEMFLQYGYEKSITSIDLILKNTFYIGIQKGKFGEAKIKMPGYYPIIDTKTYNKVNNITYYITSKEKGLRDNIHFKNILLDEDKNKLLGYTRKKGSKNYVYYKNSKISTRRLHISQTKVLSLVDNYIELNYNFSKEFLDEFGKNLKKDFKVSTAVEQEKRRIRGELKKIELNKKELTKKLIEGIVDNKLYQELSVGYMQNKRLNEEKLEKLSIYSKKIHTLIGKWIEPLNLLYTKLKTKNPGPKVQLFKLLRIEPFIKDDYSLKIEENRLLFLTKKCFFNFGCGDRN